jgi:hypothetical protein
VEQCRNHSKVSTPFEWLIRSGYARNLRRRERVGHSIGRDPARAGNEIAGLDVRADAGECAVNMNEAFRRFPPLQRVGLSVASASAAIAWEVIFVDDNSPDGTWDAIRRFAPQDSRARCIRRLGRRGLSTWKTS